MQSLTVSKAKCSCISFCRRVPANFPNGAFSPSITPFSNTVSSKITATWKIRQVSELVVGKVHLFWEGHKNLKVSPNFLVTSNKIGRFFSNFCGHNIWILWPFSYLRITVSKKTSVINVSWATNNQPIINYQQFGMNVNKFGNQSSQQFPMISQWTNRNVVTSRVGHDVIWILELWDRSHDLTDYKWLKMATFCRNWWH